MAKVLFSITDAQLRCLQALTPGAQAVGKVDKRTLTGLRKHGFIAQGDDAGRHVLTPQGAALLALCELLAISSGKSRGKGKP